MVELLSRNVSARVKMECVSIVFRVKWTKVWFPGTFCEFQNGRNTIKTRSRCVLVVFIWKCKKSTSISTQIFSIEIEHWKFPWISKAFFRWLVKNSKNGTVATFYDVCGVFGPDFGHFLHFPSRLKVIQVFKAKKEAFRERFCANA